MLVSEPFHRVMVPSATLHRFMLNLPLRMKNSVLIDFLRKFLMEVKLVRRGASFYFQAVWHIMLNISKDIFFIFNANCIWLNLNLNDVVPGLFTLHLIIITQQYFLVILFSLVFDSLVWLLETNLPILKPILIKSEL